ncbi:MAG: DUF1080 domain-containing protein [Planctomycetes bacterium]|nr:DUF1080 domain-containing protein [Planctomycetota bacterium]
MGSSRRALGALAAVAGLVGVVMVLPGAQDPPWTSGIDWPKPEVIDPGSLGGPPSDAIVLFDGKDLSQWNGAEKWTVQDGHAVCGGNLATKRAFGDCQLHVEWASPAQVKGSSQARGNSGVYLMGFYEIQILDSYDNETYHDGQAASVYKQRPPLVNVCRKPGEWQSYDIIFRAPRFDEQGKLVRPAYVTLLHNGVLVQDHFELLGRSAYRRPPQYAPHEPKLPLHLQFHGCPVRFRNVWIRELPDDDGENLLAPLRAKLNGRSSKP